MQEPVGTGQLVISTLVGESTLAEQVAKQASAGLLIYLSHAPGVPSLEPVGCTQNLDVWTGVTAVSTPVRAELPLAIRPPRSLLMPLLVHHWGACTLTTQAHLLAPHSHAPEPPIIDACLIADTLGQGRAHVRPSDLQHLSELPAWRGVGGSRLEAGPADVSRCGGQGGRDRCCGSDCCG